MTTTAQLHNADLPIVQHIAISTIDFASKKEAYSRSWILKSLLVGTKSKDTSAFQGG